MNYEYSLGVKDIIGNVDPNDKLICKICGKKYVNDTGLKIHLCKIHRIVTKKSQPRGEVKCRLCNYETNKLKNLSSHLINSHKNITIEEYYNRFLKKDINEGICVECGNKTRFIYLTKGYRRYCSIKCSVNSKETRDKIKNTCLVHFGYSSSNSSSIVKEKKQKNCLEKYGKDNPFKLEFVKQKIIETNLKKYGVKYSSQSEMIRKKNIETNIKHYGVEFSFQSEEIKTKIKKLCLDKYGLDYFCQSKEVKEKIKLSNLNHFGVDHPFKTKEVKEKSKKTSLERFGVEHPSQSLEVKEKVKRTCLERFGNETYFKCPLVKEKIKKTLLRKYGFDNWIKTPQGRQISRQTSIRLRENQKNNNEPLFPSVGDKERECLNELQKYTKFIIYRNLNIIGYFPDGYISEIRLIIEYDEKHHFIDKWKTYNSKDLRREYELAAEATIIFRVKESDWVSDPKLICENFKILIEELEKCQQIVI